MYEKTRSRNRHIALLRMVIVLLLAACNAPPAAPQVEVSPPVIQTELPETGLTPTVTETELPGTGATPTLPAAGDDSRPFVVDNVTIQIGEGSPIPVDAFVSGSWPDLCAQLGRVSQRVEGSHFEISLEATPADPNCPPDRLGLPFRIAIPLNMVEMPQGTYSVWVNGAETSFDWEVGGDAAAPEAVAGGNLRPITIEDVRVEIGVGSPIPVDAFVSGTWPDLCAQIALIEQRVDGERFEISLLATAANPDCPPDQLGLPFRIAIPLNMVEMGLGEYTVAVNGVETTFEWKNQPGEVTETPPGVGSGFAGTVAYTGVDGNLWVLDGQSGEPRQITTDAATGVLEGSQPGETIAYYFPTLSSDAKFLAYRRDAGTPVEDGLQYQFGLWVYDLTSEQSRQILDQTPAGFAWKPGTHLLAYGLGVPEGYFSTRGDQPDASLAKGIWALDMDQGDPYELVPPERGYALYTPVWSPDGRVLSFDELLYMEGRGNFAFYDLEAQEYSAWDEPIGSYSWSPDGAQIAYDRLTYTATGEERIFLRDLQGGQERQFSPDFEGGYAFSPVFSPQGDRLAYLAGLGGIDSPDYTLFVHPLEGGEPRELGVFESALGLTWSPDGESLVFSAGPYPAQQVIAVDAADGASTVLSQGSAPAVAAP